MSKIKVYIDPGHGGRDSGATNGIYKEKDFTLNVGLHLKRFLEDYGMFEVRMSRTTDQTVSLQYRSDDANKWKADIFISIHCNSADITNALGFEVYCYKYKYRKLSDKIHNQVIKSGLYYKDRGVKEGNFHVVRETNMNACLVETAFISNEKDLELLKTNQVNFARAIYYGVIDYYGLEIKEPSIPNSKVFYRVCTGSFTNFDYAVNQKKELESKGYNVNIYQYTKE